MDQKQTMMRADGLGLRESCRYLVEMWLHRDLRRLMQLSLSFADEGLLYGDKKRTGPGNLPKTLFK